MIDCPVINSLPLHEYIAMKNQLVELQAKLSDKFAPNGCIIDDLANMVHLLIDVPPVNSEDALVEVNKLSLTYGYTIKRGNQTYEINRSSPEVMEIIVR